MDALLTTLFRTTRCKMLQKLSRVRGVFGRCYEVMNVCVTPPK